MDYDISTDIQKVKFTREAAQVQRTHTVPHFGEHSNGQHSFNMLVMLRILWPEAPIRLVWAILEHDMPERLTGDIPAPSKWAGVVDNNQLTLLEMEINEKIFGQDSIQKLSDSEISWLKGLDILELYLWSKDQLMLGNRNVEMMANRIERFIEGNNCLFAEPVLDFYYKVRNHPWYMMPDLGDNNVT
ncbi:MAG: HD domain-containing protein [Candidatus Thorarchaeota archaeon]|jgi:5'-deoxynucleotidase YfbR-like HD superfamily hydrolase